MRTIGKRSNEKPWITNGIRGKARRKKRLCREQGRSQAWWKADARLQEEINSKKQAFVDQVLDALPRNYYEAVKLLSGHDQAGNWDVMQLFPEESPEAAGAKILDFFTSVGGGNPAGVMPEVPHHDDAGLGVFTLDRVEDLLTRSKKVKSMVDGDPMPHLIQKFPRAFAGPVSDIFTAINREVKWPQTWKKEHITVIPKCQKPSTLSECRNISCTAYLSKVLENVLLSKLREELAPDPEQFGGKKGCGAEHLLIELRDKILESLDTGKHAACLLGIDFEKVFNRMEHSTCVSQLQLLGASPGSLGLVRAFLSNRVMTIKLAGRNCGERKISQGSPQGSVLGSTLYCATTQRLTQDVADGARAGSTVAATGPDLNEFQGDPFEGVGLPHFGDDSGRILFFPGGSSSGSEDDINFWDSQQEIVLLSEEAHNLTMELEVTGWFKYIVDTNLVESVALENAVRNCTKNRTQEVVVPLGLEAGLVNLANKAEEIGMMVN